MGLRDSGICRLKLLLTNPSPLTPTHIFLCSAFQLEQCPECCESTLLPHFLMSYCGIGEKHYVKCVCWSPDLFVALINKTQPNFKDRSGLEKPLWYSDMKYHHKQDKRSLVSRFPKIMHILFCFSGWKCCHTVLKKRKARSYTDLLINLTVKRKFQASSYCLTS